MPLGNDRDDDGGTPPPADTGSIDWMPDGDLRLDDYYAAERPAQQGTGADDEEASARLEADAGETDVGVDTDREDPATPGRAGSVGKSIQVRLRPLRSGQATAFMVRSP